MHCCRMPLLLGVRLPRTRHRHLQFASAKQLGYGSRSTLHAQHRWLYHNDYLANLWSF